jgi:hypothetical protein
VVVQEAVAVVAGVNNVNITGADGTNGTDGTDGTNGTNGTNGTDGTDGTNGADGTTGADGTNGADGNNGADGTNAVMPVGADPGDILYWDGSVWQLTPEPANPECGKLILTLIVGVPTWTSESICIDGGYPLSGAPLATECPVWTAADLSGAVVLNAQPMWLDSTWQDQVIVLELDTEQNGYGMEFRWQMNLDVDLYWGYPHGRTMSIYDNDAGEQVLSSEVNEATGRLDMVSNPRRAELRNIEHSLTVAEFDACGVLLHAAALAGSN